MYKVIGTALVVNVSTIGDQLLLRFPPKYIPEPHQKREDTIFTEQNSQENPQHFQEENMEKNEEEKLSSGFPWADSQQELTEHEFYNLRSDIVASVLVPKPALCNKPFEIRFDKTTFIGFPVTIDHKKKTGEPPITLEKGNTAVSLLFGEELEQNENKNNETSCSLTNSSNSSAPKRSETNEAELRIFNFCLVLADVNDMEGKNFDPSFYGIGKISKFKEIVQVIAGILKHEELRCGFVDAEVKMMLNIRDAWVMARMREDQSLKPDHNALTYQLLSVSSLAKTISQLYNQIRTNGVINVKFNDWISTALSLKEKNNHSDWPIRPYQTILLLPPEEGWDMALPRDSSPTLRKFIQMAKPTKSFRELAVETDIPLNQLFLLTGHLVHWSRARVINTLTKTNIYVLNHRSHFSDNLKKKSGVYLKILSEEFTRTFPSFRFEEILDRFSQPKPLANHVNWLTTSLQRDFVDVVIWLMRKNLLNQLYTFVFLDIPKPPSGTLDEPPPKLPSEVIPLTSFEEQYIQGLDDQSDLYQIFKRVAPYLRGRHPIEEILWRENISREELDKVLMKYRSIVTKAMYEFPSEIHQ